VICADIGDITIQNASMVVLNLTLQFINPKQRQALINAIYQGLNKGGVLIWCYFAHKFLPLNQSFQS
jgi:tRNA (cmo5U34)-methyltransferase